jgi:hypothetical protein
MAASQIQTRISTEFHVLVTGRRHFESVGVLGPNAVSGNEEKFLSFIRMKTNIIVQYFVD